MTPTLATAVQALRDAPRDAYRVADDPALLELNRLAAQARRLADLHLALAAGEIDRRSDPELGGAGLARRQGARTVEDLLKTSGGMTGRDAVVAVRIGRLAAGDDGLGARVAEGSVSVQAAESIRAGLEGASTDAGLLADATEMLCDEAQSVDPDRLLKRAREVRDELDEAGIADREATLRRRRSIKRIDLRDGMKRIIWDYDPETAGIVDEIYDRSTSPRRGGPRFVDSEQARRASELERDPRTTEQIASDAFAELLRQATALDPGVLVGKGTPAVRVLVSADDLTAGTGHGTVEGTGESLSIATVQRLACANGTRAALIDSVGNVLDLAREQRLYSATQRLALAVRDGGCMWAGCDRPPSWTEAHHIDHWARDGGRTDLDRGILLCKHHHLRVHNEGWEITRREGRFWLHPPPGHGGSASRLETKSRAIREHVNHRRARAG